MAFLVRALRARGRPARGHVPLRRAAPAASAAAAAERLGARALGRADRARALRPRGGRRPARGDPRLAPVRASAGPGARALGGQRVPRRGDRGRRPGRRRPRAICRLAARHAAGAGGAAVRARPADAAHGRGRRAPGPDRLLAAVASLDEAALHAALREAVDHHLLVVDESGRGYAFRHALAREAVYDDMLPGERVRLHTAYAEALDAEPELAGDAAAEAALAYHCYAAHDLPRALQRVRGGRARRAARLRAGRGAAASRARARALAAGRRRGRACCGVDRRGGPAARLRGRRRRRRHRARADAARRGAGRAGAEADPQRQAVLLVARSFELRALGHGEEATPSSRRRSPPMPPASSRAGHCC